LSPSVRAEVSSPLTVPLVITEALLLFGIAASTIA
jgi:hypothetical protein